MASMNQCDQCGQTFRARARGGRFCSKRCFGLDRRGRTVWTVPALIRFWKKVDKRTDGECWPWLGAKNNHSGHGHFMLRSKPDKKLVMAYRFMWMITFGRIPADMCICHRCDNPSCVNPAHLFLGTQADNLRDMREKGRQAVGEQCGKHLLTADDVIALRIQAALGVSQTELAQRFNTVQSHVSKIVSGQRWAHLEVSA